MLTAQEAREIVDAVRDRDDGTQDVIKVILDDVGDKSHNGFSSLCYECSDIIVPMHPLGSVNLGRGSEVTIGSGPHKIRGSTASVYRQLTNLGYTVHFTVGYINISW